MMSGYGMHGYGNQAMELFHQMRTCGPAPNDVTFIAILSAFARTGSVREGREVLTCRMDRVDVVRRMMISKGLKKQVGYSLVEVDYVNHMFCMGDKSHPQTAELYKYLDELMWKARQAGYVPEIDSMMHELEEEEREVALRFHSEKLAIAFGLMNSSEGFKIRIIKNIRMCDDCHSAIKFIATVTCREIIVRDKHRFHHFKEGHCSCMDYW
ncbi:Pentatricopeptide repeat-containing protein [Thalictrum thalictroides]|uniref:Pentatricopeptide repeat-containing protein n=1 Tax=Thalictrum thalictroides TaxID=46969 RepID=A0A7J6VJ43_THATH|nr:Pentatricopeptide repeat-containing protein [Thalictrum thalictroides]